MARWIRHAVLVAGGPLAGALLCEGALRLYRPFASLPLRAILEEEVAPAGAYALRLVPGGRPILREAEFALPADVVAVGDSMTFGSLVLEREVFTTRLAEETGLRVLNLGRPNAGPCTYARMLDLAFARLPQPPGRILYVLFTNDVVEGPCRPLRDNEVFVWDSEVRGNPWLAVRRLRENVLGGSAVYQLAKRWLNFRGLHVGPSFRPILFEHGEERFAFDPPSYWKPLTDRGLPIVAAGVEETRRKIRTAQRRTTEAGSRLTLVLMPSKEQVYLPERVARKEIAPEAYDSSADELFDTVAELASEDGVSVLDLRAGLRQAASVGEKLYFTVDGHLTPQGHRRVAALVRVELARGEP